MSNKQQGSPQRHSAFNEMGIKKAIEDLVAQARDIYLSDEIPWVVGYSGGKDSTASLQITWMALESLSPEKRHKPVHVISTDTLVENPVVAAWVENSLVTMGETAKEKKLNITPHRLTPAVPDSFWVNLIGKGYPSPRFKFRWCTERMKINPANTFVRDVVKDNGEAILVLGTRKAESSARHARMKKLEKMSTREFLNPSLSLPNCYAYSPIGEWSNDDVWMFLMQYKNPWGYSNKDLLTMYQGASADGECPLVMDTTTPSCGSSRFGCWVCTLVEKDKSMHAMIQNDEEKHWMRPLIKFRDLIEPNSPNERKNRDFRRMRGTVQAMGDSGFVPGPYIQDFREFLLCELLKAQKWIRENGPKYVKNIDLITLEELEEVRRVWIVEKHEMEDRLPEIYREVMKEEYPGRKLDDNSPFGAGEMKVLKEICGADRLQYQLARELIHVEQGFKHMSKRSGLFESLEGVFKKHYYDDENDAVKWAHAKQKALNGVQEPTEEVDAL